MPKNILLADSGSTKTDWCLIIEGKKKKFSTQGINPYFLQEKEIVELLSKDIKKSILKSPIHEIHFYGAGLGNSDNQKSMAKILRNVFSCRKVSCDSDMLASARATCGHEKGIACILGTGSNTCSYNGRKIGFKTLSLGYILGDEGGGTALGKKLLQYYLHDIMENDLKAFFEAEYKEELDHVLDHLYRKPFPNRYLAQFARFIFQHRGHYMIENIAEDVLNELFVNHLLRYPKIHQLPVHFTGTVAHELKDLLKNLCEQYEIKMGRVLRKPIDGLIEFHSQS